MADPRFVVLGGPDHARTHSFIAAARQAGRACSWTHYIRLAQLAPDARKQEWGDSIAKLDSPGRNALSWLVPMTSGAELTEPEFSAYRTSGDNELDATRAFGSRSWYLGWRAILRRTAAFGREDRVRFANDPEEIVTMFDKIATHELLRTHGVPVPVALPMPRNCDELLQSMLETGLLRVFLKPAHGHSGSGVLAFELSRTRWRGTTALEFEQGQITPDFPDGVRLYATQRVRVIEDRETLRRLIDALCRERLHVEAWIPKAGVNDRIFDLRIVVIGGIAGPIVLRLARTTLTNLHLGAEKGGEELLVQLGGESLVRRVREVAEQTMRCFPNSLYAGVDLAVTPDLRRIVVLEVNAFGDWLENVTWRGADVHTWEVRALTGHGWPPSAR